MEAERPVEAPSVRVGEQFGGVEALSALRIVRALDAETISRASAKARRKAAKNAVGGARHRDASNLAVAVMDTQRSALGIGKLERRFKSARGDRDTPRGLALAHS